MRIVLFLLLVCHALIHLLGTAKAFGWGNISQLTQPISQPQGFFWTFAAALFLVSAALFFLRKESWALVAIAAVLVSQTVIMLVWKDAWFGTIANALILIAAVLSLFASNFEHNYRHDVRDLLQATNFRTDTLTEAHIAHLPPPVQQYLRYVGVVGRPVVVNFRAQMRGRMRSRETDWFSFRAQQYSFIDSPARYFFMKAKISGLPITGYHKYEGISASMVIRLLSAITVQHTDSPELFKAETVTFLNDLCLFAPAGLIDSRLEWGAWDNHSATVSLRNGGTNVSATLHFNGAGELENFVSDDRYDVSENKTVRFSTPVSGYRDFNGYRLPSFGEAIWHYAEGAFTYGEFHIQKISYNVPKLIN
ncbi:MAG: hypothetical protein CMC08_09840 [Flavobacteriaceae bacterium]|nr:hypothetical protein [Flavobacteriaceae bacterium]